MHTHTSILPSAIGNQSVFHTVLLRRDKSSFLEVCKDTALSRTATSTQVKPQPRTQRLLAGERTHSSSREWHQPVFQHCPCTHRQLALTREGAVLWAKPCPAEGRAGSWGLNSGSGKALMDSTSLSSSHFGLPESFYLKGIHFHLSARNHFHL